MYFDRTATVGIVCHSVGCTSTLQLMITHPRYNNLVKPFISLGPFFYADRMNSIPLNLIASAEPITRNYLMPVPLLKSLLSIVAIFIRGNKLAQVLFIVLYSLTGGFNIKEYDLVTTWRVCAHFPAGAAYRILSHFGQRAYFPDVRAYDYGPEKNLARYGSLEPPPYRLDKIINKYMVFFSGSNDFIATPRNVDRLERGLKGMVQNAESMFNLQIHLFFLSSSIRPPSNIVHARRLFVRHPRQHDGHFAHNAFTAQT